jgi:hypothetical protein
MFSISMDIFYPSAGTVFSKEGVFQQPQAVTLTPPVNGWWQTALCSGQCKHMVNRKAQQESGDH